MPKVKEVIVDVITKYDEDCCRVYFYSNALDAKSVVITDAEAGNGILNMLVCIIYKKYNIEEIDDIKWFFINIKQHKLYHKSISKVHTDIISAITID
jgi:hypothetical protein